MNRETIASFLIGIALLGAVLAILDWASHSPSFQ